jgi:hypothetical protein
MMDRQEKFNFGVQKRMYSKTLKISKNIWIETLVTILKDIAVYFHLNVYFIAN